MEQFQHELSAAAGVGREDRGAFDLPVAERAPARQGLSAAEHVREQRLRAGLDHVLLVLRGRIRRLWRALGLRTRDPDDSRRREDGNNDARARHAHVLKQLAAFAGQVKRWPDGASTWAALAGLAIEKRRRYRNLLRMAEDDGPGRCI